ncbi:MAG: DegT/DnrJ/EryC1/StrS family aminotransferase [Planctomycetales bacterium]|nr:DegT/DnrJ/EryC1/StrS family aminotransferase [Planctomycetales bacterium]
MPNSHQQCSSNIPVPLLDVGRGNSVIRDEVLAAIAEVYDSGRFLHGPQVTDLENYLAARCHSKFAVGCASGSDALLLALMALDIGPGDEVIVPSFTFFATASCVSRLGAKIVFVDIDPRTYNIDPNAVEAAITTRTRAIIPVHLFGQSAALTEIVKIASRNDIPVIEDAAQAIGAAYHGRPVCSWGQMGCISFYPTKNLGGFGDGGMLTTDNEQLADRLRLLAGHGMRPRYYHSEVGINSRLDTFQAAGLLVKCRHLDHYTLARQTNAQRYFELFHEAGLDGARGFDDLTLPYVDPAAFHVWNQFSLRIPFGRRDALRTYLQQSQIGCEIYYPVPLHEQTCFRRLGYATGSLPHTEAAAREILHLPIYPEMRPEEQTRVVSQVASFFRANCRAVA